MGNPSTSGGIVGRVSAGRVSLASRPWQAQVRRCDFSDEQADCGRVPPRGTSLRPHFFCNEDNYIVYAASPKATRGRHHDPRASRKAASCNDQVLLSGTRDPRALQTVKGLLFILDRGMFGSGLGVGLSWSVQDQLAVRLSSALELAPV